MYGNYSKPRSIVRLQNRKKLGVSQSALTQAKINTISSNFKSNESIFLKLGSTYLIFPNKKTLLT
jgi:hypothetical protein